MVAVDAIARLVTDGPFQTTDVMPTILKTMGIPLTGPVDGKARPLK